MNVAHKLGVMTALLMAMSACGSKNNDNNAGGGKAPDQPSTLCGNAQSGADQTGTPSTTTNPQCPTPTPTATPDPTPTTTPEPTATPAPTPAPTPTADSLLQARSVSSNFADRIQVLINVAAAKDTVVKVVVPVIVCRPELDAYHRHSWGGMRPCRSYHGRYPYYHGHYSYTWSYDHGRYTGSGSSDGVSGSGADDRNATPMTYLVQMEQFMPQLDQQLTTTLASVDGPTFGDNLTQTCAMVDTLGGYNTNAQAALARTPMGLLTAMDFTDNDTELQDLKTLLACP